MDRSTAGPASGSLSIVLTFDNKNVRLIISQDQNECFSLQKENDKFHILKDKKIFLENVEIMPILLHAPRQAFINLDDRCIYSCAFCNLSKQGFLQKYDAEKFVNLILKASNRSDFQAVALTSGVYPDNTEIIKKMCYRLLAKLDIHDPLLDVAKELEAAALKDDYFIEHHLYPNVDFYSGIVLRAIGIPTNMFTVMFAIGRLPGWIAQWKESMDDPHWRLSRPRQLYTGPLERAYVPIHQR